MPLTASESGRGREDSFPMSRAAACQSQNFSPLATWAGTHLLRALCSTALMATGRMRSSTRVRSARSGSQSNAET